MDIQKIEHFVTRWYEELAADRDAKQSEIVPMMELSLLLAIYKKLERIESKLEGSPQA